MSRWEDQAGQGTELMALTDASGLPLAECADSDPLDAEKDIELIAPHRRNRKKTKTQDGRRLRRYKRRWKIERLLAWLGNFRALYSATSGAENYLGFVKLGCLVILPRYL